jgi:hypothetical protein
LLDVSQPHLAPGLGQDPNDGSADRTELATTVRPAGTGLCITGLGVFSSLIFSSQITDGQKSYGPAGVVLALISFLVGFGVCLHAGAVFGRMWNDYRDDRASIEQSSRA